MGHDGPRYEALESTQSEPCGPFSIARFYNSMLTFRALVFLAFPNVSYALSISENLEVYVTSRIGQPQRFANDGNGRDITNRE